MTNTASPGSFYNENAVTYTETNPPGPADTPVVDENSRSPFVLLQRALGPLRARRLSRASLRSLQYLMSS